MAEHPNTLTAAPRRIQVLLVDDHAVIRDAMGAALANDARITVVGAVESGDAALAWLQMHDGAVDVVLLDVDMPGLTGLETAHQVHGHWPHCGILLLTSYPQFGAAALRAGARGYLLKGSTLQEIVTAICAVHRGTLYMQAWQQDAVMLSDREIAVLELLADSYSNAEIAAQLSWSERSVRTHITHILSKLKARGREQAVRLAMRRGDIR